MKGRLGIALGFLLLLVCVPARPLSAPPEDKPKPLTADSRMAIVRILGFEYAMLKQPLPASQKEEEGLEVLSTGAINEEKLRDDLAHRGAALHTGETVQVTAIQFKDSYILFEINGGGKKKKKWYERIQVQGSLGGPVQVDPPRRVPSTRGEPVGMTLGSWVLLTFPDYVPDLEPEAVKEMLANVLDFSSRSAALPWIETIPEEFREAIKEKKAKVGMNREMVLAALGRPQNKVRELKDGVEHEDWIYGNPPFVTFVTFVEDKVVAVKEYQ